MFNLNKIAFKSNKTNVVVRAHFLAKKLGQFSLKNILYFTFKRPSFPQINAHLFTYHANMCGKFHSESNRYDEDNGRNSAQLNFENSHSTNQLHHYGGQHHNDDCTNPWVHEQERGNYEDGGDNAHQSDGQPRPKVKVLLPEGERDPAWKIGKAPFLEFLADLSNLSNGFHCDICVG